MSVKSANDAFTPKEMKDSGVFTAQHAMFVIDRHFDAPLERVYQAFADEQAKSLWFGGSDAWTLVERAFDFRVGGRELLVGKWKSGMITKFDATYHDIIPNKRIVYAYDMFVDKKHLSVSLASIEFAADGKRTRMKLTEQGAFLDGYDDSGSRERGTNELMNRLGASLV